MEELKNKLNGIKLSKQKEEEEKKRKAELAKQQEQQERVVSENNHGKIIEETRFNQVRS